MGKNRKKGGGGTSQPHGTSNYSNEEVQKWKDELTTQIGLTEEEAQKVLDAVLNDKISVYAIVPEGISFVENNKKIQYSESPEGKDHETYINFESDTLKTILDKNSNFSIETLMDAYNSVPEMNRALVENVNINGDFQGAGGAYNTLSHNININKDTFTDKKLSKSMNIYKTMYHEMGHALDGNHSSFANISESNPGQNKLIKTLKNTGNKGSTYSECYNPETSPFKVIASESKYYTETLAEVVAVTREARRVGGSNAYIEDPKVKIEYPSNSYRGHDITYNQWSKENPELAKLGNEIADAKSTHDFWNVIMEE